MGYNKVSLEPAMTTKISPESIKKPTAGEVAVRTKRGTAAAPVAGRFLKIFRATPGERHKIIQNGVPADFIVDVAAQMDIPRERLLSILKIPSSTAKRKIAQKATLSAEVSARLIGVEKLIGQVEDMVRQSGDPEQSAGFDAAKWIAHWIETPLPALGGDKPASYLDNDEGVTLVSNLLARMQSGGYA